MNQSIAEAAVADTTTPGAIDKIRLAWFALGCTCLTIGSFYLSSVDLGGGANLAEMQESVTSVETASVAAE